MSKGEYSHKAIDGIVISVTDKHLPTGKYIATARIQDDQGKIWFCTYWDELAIAFMSKGLLQQRVYVDGGIKEENAVSVNFFNGITNKPKETKPVSNVEEYEEFEELRDDGGDEIKIIWSDRRGLRTYKMEHKRNFVCVNGKWEKKMDYCLRIMGSSLVMSYLRDFEGVTSGKLSAPSKFKEKMDMMLQMCKENTSDVLTYFGE